MKKYIQPAINTVVISTGNLMLEGSNNLSAGVNGLDDVTVSETEYAGGESDARRHSLWDDED